MKQSDTNAIANLYVESINRGAEDPSKVSNETYNKICTMVEKLKKQGVSLEDAKYRIADSLEYPENTDDLGHTIERVWSKIGSGSVAHQWKRTKGVYVADQPTSWLQRDGTKIKR